MQLHLGHFSLTSYLLWILGRCHNIEETLSPTLHLPVLSEDTVHFCHYLCTHVLIANKQVLLLTDVPIQD